MKFFVASALATSALAAATATAQQNSAGFSSSVSALDLAQGKELESVRAASDSASESENRRICTQDELAAWEAFDQGKESYFCSRLAEAFGACDAASCLAIAERAAPVAPNCVRTYDIKTEADFAKANLDKCVFARDHFDAKTMYGARSNMTAPVCARGVFDAFWSKRTELKIKYDCDVPDICTDNCMLFIREQVQQAPTCRDQFWFNRFTVQETMKNLLANCLAREGKNLDEDPDLYANPVVRPTPTPTPPTPTTTMPPPMPSSPPPMPPSPKPTPPLNDKCSAEFNFDFEGKDIASVSSVDHFNLCCDKCRGYAGCNAYTWTNYNNGTCWLKSERGNAKPAVGAHSGVVASPLVDPNACPNRIEHKGVDIVGNDVGTAKSATATGCCAECKKTPSCRAYTWTQWENGTCFLKSSINKIAINAAATSYELYTRQADTDFKDADLSNVVASSVDECVNACTLDPRKACRAVTWFNGVCYMKTRAGERIVKKDAISVELQLVSP